MNKHSKSAGFWRGKGFYVALTLIVACSMLASFLAIDTMIDSLGADPGSEEITGEEDIVWQLEDTPIENKQESVPVEPSSSASQSSKPSSSQPASSAASAASEAPQQPAEQPAVQEPLRVWPVSGEVTAAFSGDELVFNETMQDWRTHNGTDLAAEEGDSVAAPVSGTVKSVSEDGRWGGVVEIEAQDGALVRLCGVQDVKTAEGQSVEAGAELGTVGEIASESAQDAHIHIEVLQNDEYTDPQLYFSQE